MDPSVTRTRQARSTDRPSPEIEPDPDPDRMEMQVVEVVAPLQRELRAESVLRPSKAARSRPRGIGRRTNALLRAKMALEASVNGLVGRNFDMKHTTRTAIATALAAGMPRVLRGLLVDPRFFYIWEKAGLHVGPADWGSPIPDTQNVSPDVWTRRTSLPGIDFAEREQLERVAAFFRRYHDEFCTIERMEGPFGDFDSFMLYSFLRSRKPRRVIEIGSGASTIVAAQALLRNRAKHGVDHEFISIDIDPREEIRGGVHGVTDIIHKPLQKVDLSMFSRLSAGDVLFIDSSHVCAQGNDVYYEFFRIIPCLANDVLVHIHDIYLPDDYPPFYTMRMATFWNEQYLLHSFLMFNLEFTIRWSGHHMAQNFAAPLAAATNQQLVASSPSSFWMERAPRVA